MVWFIVIAVVVVVIAVVAKVQYDTKRREMLMGKYGDENIVDMIMRGEFWQGQTEEQVIDSLGQPADVDQKVLKTKTKEIWKYQHQGGNRYRLRVTIENGIVVGWDRR